MKTLSKILLATALLSSAAFTQAATVLKTATASFETEDRHLSGFDAIDAHGSFDVYVTQGGSESVKVDAPANIINQIETKVEGGVLKLGIKDHTSWNWGWNNAKMAVYVTVKDIRSINLTGSGDVYFKSGLRSNRLKLSIVGSGDMTGKVEAEALESSIVGSGDMRLSGRATTSVVSVHGSGDFTANALNTSETQVNLSGSGDAHVNVNTKIDASLSGSGDIYYSGNARQINSSKHGSGEIHHI